MRHLAHKAMSTSEVPTAAPRSSSRAIRRSAQPRRLLADVLWDAANSHLFHVYRSVDDSKAKQSSYSCAAACYADVGHRYDNDDKSAAVRFLYSLGVREMSFTRLHEEFPDSEDRQGVRYMWLLLAMHVAEDEGITV